MVVGLAVEVVKLDRVVVELDVDIGLVKLNIVAVVQVAKAIKLDIGAIGVDVVAVKIDTVVVGIDVDS